MNERILTCIVCPKGCEMTVSFDGEGNIDKIAGYTCKRGEAYARTECMHPMRTVTTTVKTAGGQPVSVKTAEPVPKEEVFAVMKQINRAVCPDSVEIGDTVCYVDAGDKRVAVLATSYR